MPREKWEQSNFFELQCCDGHKIRYFLKDLKLAKNVETRSKGKVMAITLSDRHCVIWADFLEQGVTISVQYVQTVNKLKKTFRKEICDISLDSVVLQDDNTCTWWWCMFPQVSGIRTLWGQFNNVVDIHLILNFWMNNGSFS